MTIVSIYLDSLQKIEFDETKIWIRQIFEKPGSGYGEEMASTNNINIFL
jgi:hypothetical protein